MRVIRQITHPQCAITVYHWNGKYLLKFEQDILEQTYKVSELDLVQEKDIDVVLANVAFMQQVMDRFTAMRQEWWQALEPVL